MADGSSFRSPREEGLRAYQAVYETALHYFDDIAKSVGLDLSEHRSHVEALNASTSLKKRLAEELQEVRRQSKKRRWLAAGLFLPLVTIPFGVRAWKKNKQETLEAIKKINDEQLLAHAKAKQARQMCGEDMQGINASLDDYAFLEVLQKAEVPIHVYPRLSQERLALWESRFDVHPLGKDEACLGAISGDVDGNPFLLTRSHSVFVSQKCYTGSLEIEWEEEEEDDEGNTVTVTHTETLTAQVFKPAPYDYHGHELSFASDVAPKLTFSRSYSGATGLEGKDKEKFLRARIKKLDEIEKHAMGSGGNFTKLGNDEFEAYFGAFDRNHEVEYRLLFTPLAQRALLSLIQNPDPYGDDFLMRKKEKAIFVSSAHSGSFPYWVSGDIFASHDFEDARKRFAKYCADYFQSIYFDLAPILAIPAYQMQRLGLQEKQDGSLPPSILEIEALLHRFNASAILPEDAEESNPWSLTITDEERDDDIHIIEAELLGYESFDEVDYVSMHGGDGEYHDVPVEWVRYEEREGTKRFAVIDTHMSTPIFKTEALPKLESLVDSERICFFRGLLAVLLEDEDEQAVFEALRILQRT